MSNAICKENEIDLTDCVGLLYLACIPVKHLFETYKKIPSPFYQGMRTYDYILAMREENRSLELEESDDSDFSLDESTDSDSLDEQPFATRDSCSEV